MKRMAVWLVLAAGTMAGRTWAQTQTPVELVTAMLAHEDDSAAHRDCFEFLSEERSDRTGGHLWRERVVEFSAGRVMLLLAEDGKPLSAQREKAERDRLAGIVADSTQYLQHEKETKDTEAKARKMLDMLPRAFLFDNVRLADGVWRMDFHPNPEYAPSGIEERVLHGMSGWVEIDEKDVRLRHIEGTLPVDVSIGFGLLASIHAGSRFEHDRRLEDGHWRTVHVLTEIRGKAALFKSVSRNSEVTRSEFVYLQPGMSLGQAVELVEKGRD